MFTSRAEFRLSLRPDNADQRLTRKGYESGCVSEERMRKTDAILSRLKENIELLKHEVHLQATWRKLFSFAPSKNAERKSAFDLLRNTYVTIDMIVKAFPARFGHLAQDRIVARRIEV